MESISDNQLFKTVLFILLLYICILIAKLLLVFCHGRISFYSAFAFKATIFLTLILLLRTTYRNFKALYDRENPRQEASVGSINIKLNTLNQ